MFVITTSELDDSYNLGQTGFVIQISDPGLDPGYPDGLLLSNNCLTDWSGFREIRQHCARARKRKTLTGRDFSVVVGRGRDPC